MTAGQFLEFLAGLALLAVAGAAWSGWWRRWAHSPWFRAGPITAFPAFALLLLLAGLLGILPKGPGEILAVVIVLAMITLLILGLADPGWLGPRWYRRFKRAFGEGSSGTHAWMAEDPRRQGESSADATFRHQTSFRPQPPFNRLRLMSRPENRDHAGLQGRRGVFVYYPHAPVWAAGMTEDGELINEIIAAESLEGACKLPPGTGLDGRVRRSRLRSYLVPRARIDTTEGAWLFESRKAKNIAHEIKRRYLDPSTDMYGFPREEGTTVHSDADQSVNLQDRSSGTDGFSSPNV